MRITMILTANPLYIRFIFTLVFPLQAPNKTLILSNPTPLSVFVPQKDSHPYNLLLSYISFLQNNEKI